MGFPSETTRRRARALTGAAILSSGLCGAAAAGAGAHPGAVRPMAVRAAAVGPRLAACNIVRDYYTLGATYVEKLSVGGLSCSSGERAVRAYNACREQHGGWAGHCTAPVEGFRCHEQRQSQAVAFVAKVSCTRTGGALAFTYTENKPS